MSEDRLAMVASLRAASDSCNYRELARRYFAMLESCLDKPKTGPTWLSLQPVAKVVGEALHYRDGSDYRLDAYSIMPNPGFWRTYVTIRFHSLSFRM